MTSRLELNKQYICEIKFIESNTNSRWQLKKLDVTTNAASDMKEVTLIDSNIMATLLPRRLLWFAVR